MHFGAELANRGRGLVPAQRPHDIVKCLALPSALAMACELMGTSCDGTELPIVVSGDLTVRGAATEFAVANAYLRSRMQIARLPGSLGQLGLGRSDNNLAVVPGNHDHWSGKGITMPSYNAGLYPNYFRPAPWSKHLKADDGSITLELLGIDSNSGWDVNNHPTWWQRRVNGGLAKGNISSAHFDQLQRLLEQSPPAGTQSLVRAVVCHHSICYRGGLVGSSELEVASRQELLRLCSENGVSLILTGHTHDPMYKDVGASENAGVPRKLFELRAANSVGFGHNSNDAEKENLGFLTHRIIRQQGELRWDTWRWKWDWGTDRRGSGGYEPDPFEPWNSFVIS
jgi:3',5'-cyclic AMP phosphodiesterase CpdA